MRDREEIEHQFNQPFENYNALIMEVLLDIRELLKPPAPMVIETDKIKDDLNFTSIFRTPHGDVITPTNRATLAKRAAGIGPCVMCLGEGFLPRGTTKNICDNCNGSGDNFIDIERLRDKQANQCEWCHGSGTDTNPQGRKILCGSCGGTGKKKQNG